MTTARFHDKFDRADGDVGSNYTIPCGGAAIFDESVIPVDLDEVQSGADPALGGATEQKTQVLYTGDTLNGPDYAVRGVWTRLDESYVATAEIDATQNDPSFTLLARMSKDPLLVDLGADEQPACYDQGYGLRVTCPRGGGNPILKIIKFTPRALAPGYNAPSTSEPDNALVLASVTLSNDHLNTDPAWDGTGLPLYQSYVQDMRLRVRRADDQVILEAYFNDRNRNTPVLKVTDHKHPLWGERGVPGFEFLSCAEANQSGTSPFGLSAIPIMFCHIFETETIKDAAPSRVSTPGNLWTFGKVAERAILLVEKQGDAKYTASFNGQTKKEIFLNFVYEAEQSILALEGYWWFLTRTGYRVYLKGQEQFYELPEECGEVMTISPSWTQPPLQQIDPEAWDRTIFQQRGTTGRPRRFREATPQVNDRTTIEVWPIPRAEEEAENLYLLVDFYARHHRAVDPDAQVPLIPQQHMNVLIYTSAALAMVLDTDMNNMGALAQVSAKLTSELVRVNNRRRKPVMTYAGHLPDRRASLMPQTRFNQLGYFIP